MAQVNRRKKKKTTSRGGGRKAATGKYTWGDPVKVLHRNGAWFRLGQAAALDDTITATQLKLASVGAKAIEASGHARVLLRLLRSTRPGIGGESRAIALAALLYFISPVDLVPDFLPLIGFVDDAAVLLVAIQQLRALGKTRGRRR